MCSEYRVVKSKEKERASVLVLEISKNSHVYLMPVELK